MDHEGTAKSSRGGTAVDAERIRRRLVEELAVITGLDSKTIGRHDRFRSLGLESKQAVDLSVKLQQWLGRPVSVTALWEHPTVEALALHLANRTEEDRRVERSQSPGAPGPDAFEPIAIVGMSCRFGAGVRSPREYWNLLRDGVDAIVEVPADRWGVDAFFDPANGPGKMTTRWGGFIDQVDRFDAPFFAISAREAIEMDPQQRIILELAWEALEDAGVKPGTLVGTSTGVFVGSMWSDYARLGDVRGIAQHTATGTDTSIIPARVSYFFGLQGPSIAVNTACSSSLVSVHLACESLRTGRSTVALAGGVSLIVSPWSTVAMSKFGAMSPDGRSKAFDAGANGYVRGEGAGLLVLKRLSKALRDGDRIHAVICGEAINNDGASNGLTAPNRYAQEAMLRDAYARACVDPRSVQYVETHGPGTILGDPIEASALAAVLAVGRTAEDPLRIGSVKTNVGHTEAAAGIAGLMKVVLAMKHRRLPASLHFNRPNPYIAFEDLRLEVQQQLGPWPSSRARLTAGVSSFGFGGTNCHVVLAEVSHSRARAVPVSADDEEALERRVLELFQIAARLETEEELDELSRASCRFVGSGRSRAVFVARSVEDLKARIVAHISTKGAPRSPGRVREAEAPRVVAVCPGYGGEWLGMARGLMCSEPIFRRALEDCDAAIQRAAGWSVLDAICAHRTPSTFGEEPAVLQPVFFQLVRHSGRFCGGGVFSRTCSWAIAWGKWQRPIWRAFSTWRMRRVL